jgi:hypothetical protein
MRILSFLILCGLFSCRADPAAEDFPALFEAINPGDTLTFYARLDDRAPLPTDTLPLEKVSAALSATMMEDLSDFVDTFSTICFARGRFALDADIEVLWMEVQNGWYNHHSLLLWDKGGHRIRDRLTVAEWYGGDGSQQLINAYLMFGKHPELVVRQTYRSTRMGDDDEVVETRTESVALWQIKGGRFVEKPVFDESRLIQNFPAQPL